jgi:uncharacterized phage protein (TIGR01671 family)
MSHRVIKFRAWDHRLKRFNDYYSRYIYEAQNIDFIELNQFTGLLDKTGIEIYEGDILHFHHMTAFSTKHGKIFSDATASVIWSAAGFTVNIIKGHLHSFDMSKGEIVGNIYENVDLLNRM